MAPLRQNSIISTCEINLDQEVSTQTIKTTQPLQVQEQGIPSRQGNNRTTCTLLHKSDDPFLYYSNAEIRIKTLKYDDSDEGSSSSSNEFDASSRPVRKTRISFELHNTAVFEDMFDDLPEEDDLDFDNFDFSQLKEKGGESNTMSLMAQLFGL